MSVNNNQGLVPRHGHTLQVILPCRVSDPGPGKQDERSNDDQEAMLRKWLDDHCDIPFEAMPLPGSGSGEFLERSEYLELIELVASDQFDLVLVEDLGRIVRRIQAHLFCEHCVDHGVRLIALNDHVDTAEEGWQDRSIFSAWHHERSNRDTSDRIKRTHRNRFNSGGCASRLIYGYQKKPGAKSDADWEKLPEAEPVYQEWFQRLDDGALYAEVADWLNAIGVPTMPYKRKDKPPKDKWDGPMVGRVTHNTLLKGLRYRNKRRSRRASSGKYKSEKAPPELLLTRQVPHLAFFEEPYYDRIVAKADARNAKYSRTQDGDDPCRNRPRKRSRFPGQTLVCIRCGSEFVWGGHGQTDHLECSGARMYRCWQGITVDGPLAADCISNAVLTAIEGLKDFDSVFLDMLREESVQRDSARDAKLRDLDRELAQVSNEIESVVRFIRGGDDSKWVREDLKRLEARHCLLLGSKDEQRRMPRDEVIIPSIDEVQAIARSRIGNLALDSFEFAQVMRTLTKPIMVAPYLSCDGGNIVLRAQFTLSLASLLPDKRACEALLLHLQRELVVDLFHPPQRVEHREDVVRLRRDHTERQVAEQLGLTVTAAQRASALQRQMDELGLTDPYVRVYEPPEDMTKLRRHRHKRYHFEPQPGHMPG